MKNKKLILLCIGLSLHNNNKTTDHDRDTLTLKPHSLRIEESLDKSEREDKESTTSEKTESPEIQSLDRTIKKILEGNPNTEIKKTLELIQEKKPLNTEQKYIAACTFHRYSNHPWLDIRLKYILDQNKYGKKTCSYLQNKETFDEFEQYAENEFSMFSNYLSEYYPNASRNISFVLSNNEEENEKVTPYEMYNIEQIVFNRVHTVKEVLGSNESFLNIDFRPWLFMKNRVANNPNPSSTYYKTIEHAIVEPEEIRSHQSLYTQINELSSSILGIEAAAKDIEVDCNLILKEETRLQAEEQSEFQKINCAQNEIDLYLQSKETKNFHKLHYMTTKIFLDLGLGSKESINRQSLKSKISLKEIESYLEKNIHLTNEEKKAYRYHFIDMAYKVDSKRFLKEVKQYQNSHKRINCSEYTSNEKLKLIINAYANPHTLCKKKLKDRTFTYEHDTSFGKLLNEACDLDNRTYNIIQSIILLRENYEESFLYLRYALAYLLDAMKENPNHCKKVMIYDDGLLSDILEKKYSLSISRLVEKYGKKLNTHNTEDDKTICYSNNRILSEGNCRNFNIDPDNRQTTLDGNKFFTIIGAGGWGKTSAAQGLILECMTGRFTGYTFTADLSLPESFLNQKLFCFHADGSLIYMKGRKPLSGSQSTGIKVNSLDELANHALKTDDTFVIGYLDETLSTVDGISTSKMIQSKEGIKALMASGKFFIGLIEHDKEKIDSLGCHKAIIFPCVLRSPVNRKFIIGDIYPYSLTSEEKKFNEIYNTLNQKEFQAGETQEIYFVLNDTLTELKLTTKEDYHNNFILRNNPRYFRINYTIKVSTNPSDHHANIILNSNNIIIKPIINEIYLEEKSCYYIYKIDISIALENEKIKIIPLKETFQIAPKNSLFTEGNRIKYMKSSFDKHKKEGSEDSYSNPILLGKIRELINNIRFFHIDQAIKNHYDKSKDQPIEKSIFTF